MSEWKPFYLSLILLIMLAVVFPIIVAGIVDIEQIDQSDTKSIVEPLTNFVEGNVSIQTQLSNPFSFAWGFVANNFNPFNIVGGTFKATIVNYLTALSLIPNIIFVPLSLIIIFGFVYTVVKMLPTT